MGQGSNTLKLSSQHKKLAEKLWGPYKTPQFLMTPQLGKNTDKDPTIQHL